MEILGQFIRGNRPLVGRQIDAIEKVLVHADGAFDLALPAKQRTQREMKVDGLRVDLDHFDERFDGLVGLLVQQEVEAAEIRQRQRPRLPQQVLDVDARGDPAHGEEDRRDRQQPPQLEIHALRVSAALATRHRACGRCGRSPGPKRASFRVRRRPPRRSSGRGADAARGARDSTGVKAARSAARPSASRLQRRSAKATNTTTTSGARKLARLKNLSSAGSLFCSDRNSRARKTVAPTIQRTMCMPQLCHRMAKKKAAESPPPPILNSARPR